MTEINMSQKLGFEFNPDYKRYIKLDEAGMFVIITCRDEGKLIGYCIFSMFPHIRYQSCKFAIEDLYYIKPEYRGKGLGKKLFIVTEEALKEKGVNQVVFSTKTYQDYSKVFESLGYQFFEKNFTKRIS